MATTSFSRTSGTPTNALKWTYSVWVKLSELIDGDRWLLDFNTDSNNRSQIGWTHDNSVPQLIVYEKVSSSTSQLFTTTQCFRDLGAFYNIVVSCDRTLATQEDRTKIYINGERVTDFHTTPNYPAQNVTGIINTAVDTLIGKYSQSTVYYDGLMSYVSFVDGTYNIFIQNPDGEAISSGSVLTVSDGPAWSTGAGTLGTFSAGEAISSTVTATGDAPITYSKTSGTFPGGLSLNTSTGVISGTESGATATTEYSFTIRASDAQAQTADRAFTMTISVGAEGATQFN